AGEDARGDPVAPRQAEAVGAAEDELDVLVLAADERGAELDVEGDAGALAEPRGLVAAVVVEAEVGGGEAVDAGQELEVDRDGIGAGGGVGRVDGELGADALEPVVEAEHEAVAGVEGGAEDAADPAVVDGAEQGRGGVVLAPGDPVRLAGRVDVDGAGEAEPR